MPRSVYDTRPAEANPDYWMARNELEAQKGRWKIGDGGQKTWVDFTPEQIGAAASQLKKLYDSPAQTYASKVTPKPPKWMRNQEKVTAVAARLVQREVGPDAMGKGAVPFAAMPEAFQAEYTKATGRPAPAGFVPQDREEWTLLSALASGKPPKMPKRKMSVEVGEPEYQQPMMVAVGVPEFGSSR